VNCREDRGASVPILTIEASASDDKTRWLNEHPKLRVPRFFSDGRSILRACDELIALSDGGCTMS
jgi:hypothetical protein